jgi:hypothetical protein
MLPSSAFLVQAFRYEAGNIPSSKQRSNVDQAAWVVAFLNRIDAQPMWQLVSITILCSQNPRQFCAMQGAAEQIFTEKGNYLLAVSDPTMVVHQRLAMVACAISIDYDYYSRRVGSGGWLFPAITVWSSND